jgi:hypothetical protein
MKNKELSHEIRRVLLEVWDPIGIVGEPNAQDEYDSYIGEVYELLVQEKSDSEILDYLLSVVRDRMGRDAATRDHMLATLSALRSIQIHTE